MNSYFEQHYELRLELDYRKKSATEFENWFCDIMELRYPGDFQRIRPYGNQGDQKCDGYLPSKKIFFQVYAPNGLMNSSNTTNKIVEDYNGAKHHWELDLEFQEWIFVHNQSEGLPPNVIRLLNRLNGSESISILQWNFVAILAVFRELNLLDKQNLYGHAPTMETTLKKLPFRNIRKILEYINRSKPILKPDLRPFAHTKLEENQLSNNAKDLIKVGRTRAYSVSEYIQNQHLPTYGDEISEAFRQEYIRLKEANYTPNEIFNELLLYSGFDRVDDPTDIVAVYAVIAYFFDSCDIFERPTLTS